MGLTMTIRTILLALVALFGLYGPVQAQTAPDLSFETSELTVVTAAGAAHVFTVEVAATPEQRAQGLMYRTALDRDKGMLFDYGRERRVSMWMKNTLIPLDMLFIRADGTIANIRERTIPHSLEAIGSKGRVLGVLELAGGTVDRLGLAPGDKVRHAIFEGN